MFLDLTLDDAILLDGQPFTLISVENDSSVGDVVVHLHGEEGPREITQHDLLQQYSQNRIVLPDPAARPADLQPLVGGSGICPADAKAQKRIYYCQAFDRTPANLSDKKLKRCIAAAADACPFEHTPPSAGSLRRWINSRGKPGTRLLRYMRDRHQKGPRGPRLDDEVEAIINAEIDAHFADLRRGPCTSRDMIWARTHELNQARVDEGLPPLKYPSESTIRRRINAARTRENTARKYGQHIAKYAFDRIRGHFTAKHPLEAIVIDHTTLDLHLVDEATSLVWGRPTLCIAIDVATRAILGYWLSIRHPSIETLIGLLRDCVRTKNARLCSLGVSGEWPMFGLPRTLLVDNGKEGVGTSFPTSCVEQGIELRVAPVATPEYKGHCERVFRTISQFVRELPGGVPGNSALSRKLRFDPASDAVLSLEEADRLIAHWIVNIYHKQPHAGLDEETPLDAWLRLSQTHPPRLVPDLDQFDSSFGHLEDRKLNRQGVRIDGLVYTGPALDQLLRDLLPTAATKGAIADSVSVKVRVMPDDISQVWVFNWVRQRYVALPCEDQTYSRFLTRPLHKQARSDSKKSGRDMEGKVERALVKSQMLAEISDMQMSKKRHERRQAVRARPATEGASISSTAGDHGTASLGNSPASESCASIPDDEFDLDL